jgi:hypothetical protein
MDCHVGQQGSRRSPKALEDGFQLSVSSNIHHRMKPNYMLIGAAKCATTTICNLLGRHPDVFMVDCKEPQFFNHDEIFARGYEWYESLYAEAGDKKMRGEGSNASTMKEQFPHALRRIVSYAPELKLIYVVRDPFERIESYWLEKRSNAGDLLHYDFNTSVRTDRHWLVDSSNYLAQIDAFRALFRRQHPHCLLKTSDRSRSASGLRQASRGRSRRSISVGIGTSTRRKENRCRYGSLRVQAFCHHKVARLPRNFRHPGGVTLQDREIPPRWKPETREWSPICARRPAEVSGALRQARRFLEHLKSGRRFPVGRIITPRRTGHRISPAPH